MSVRRRFTIGAIWSFAGSWAEQVLNMVFFVVLARLLGAELFGLAMMAVVVVTLAEFLVRDSIADALINLKEIEPGHLDAVFWALNLLAVVIMAAIYLSADLVAAIYGEARVAELLRWLSPTVLFMAIAGVPVAILRRRLRFEFLALRATISVVLGGIVGISMAMHDYGALSLVGQRLVQMLASGVIVWIGYSWRPGLRPSIRHFQDVWDFGAKMVGVRASEFFSFQAPAFVTAIFVGPVLFGYFSLAWRIVEMLAVVLIVPLCFAAQPAFAKLRGESAGARELLMDTTFAAALIAFPSFAGLAAVAPAAIIHLFGEGWEPAIPILRILCFAGFYLSIVRLHNAFVLAMGHAGWSLALTFSEAFVGVVLVLVAGDQGLVAVAAAMTLRYYLLWPFSYLMINRLIEIGVTGYVRPLVPIVIASLVLAAAVLASQNLILEWDLGVWELASGVAVGVITYVIFVFIVMPEKLLALKRSLKSADF